MVFGTALLLACGGFAQEKKGSEEGKKDENLPKAEEVLERYIKAIGGRDAFAEHESQHAVGTIDMTGQQQPGKLEVFAARPNKLLVLVEIPGIGKVTTGFNGKVGWMNNPLTGPMLLPEAMLGELAAQADFDHALHRPEDYKTIEMLGVEEFGGEECYKLHLVHRTGFESTEFFNKETGLQEGFISEQASPLGKVKVTTHIDEYKKFNGILMASKITQNMSGMEQKMEIKSMEFDTVPDSKFELPPQIKTLAGDAEPAGEGGPEK